MAIRIGFGGKISGYHAIDLHTFAEVPELAPGWKIEELAERRAQHQPGMPFWSVKNDRVSEPAGLESINLTASKLWQDAVIVRACVKNALT